MNEEKITLREMLRGEYDYYVRQWIDYQANNQNRAKLLHDIKLFDGREFNSYYPNGNSWNRFYGKSGPDRVNDDSVAFIRLSVRQIGDPEIEAL